MGCPHAVGWLVPALGAIKEASMIGDRLGRRLAGYRLFGRGRLAGETKARTRPTQSPITVNPAR